MKIIVSLLLLLCSLWSMGCGGQKEGQNHIEKRDPEAVVLGGYRHLAPGNKDAMYCSRIMGVWEPLVTKDMDNKPAPCLAQSWEMRDGGKEWIFHLRRDVYFHNGTKFTADSVVKNFDRMKKGYKRSTFYGMDINVYYPSLQKYEKLDDYTFRLVFAEPNVNELYKMTDFGSPIYAPECFAEDGNFNGIAIGTGPYKITENVWNKYVVIERNENYYGEPAKIKKFILRNIPSTDARYAALKSGEIDGVLDINAIPPFSAEEIKKDERFGVSVNKSSMLRFLAVNGTRFPFNDVRMRQAVSLAIDRSNLVQALYLNYAVPTTNLLNYTSPYYHEFPVEYNLEKAKRLAREVLGDQRYTVTYCINGSEPLQKGEAELIAYWLRDIGLDVKIQSLEYATMARMMRKGDYDIGRIQTGLPNGDPYSIFYSFMMLDGGRSRSSSLGYANAEVTELLTLVKHCTDEAERRRMYNRIQEIAVQEQPIIPLFNDKNVVAYNKRLKNYSTLIYGIDLAKVELVD